MDEQLSRLKKQIEKIPSLAHVKPWGPEFQLWGRTTEKLISEIFGIDAVKLFKGQNTVTFSYIEDGYNDQQYQRELDGKRRILEGLLEEVNEVDSTTEIIEGDILKTIWRKEQALKDNLLTAQEAEAIQKSLIAHLQKLLPSDSIPGLRLRKISAERKHQTWWADNNGYPTENSWMKIQPFLELLEQYEAEKTIKKRLETEGLFVESRSQGEDQHLLIGKRDGAGEKAHVIIDGKNGEVRIEDKQKEPTELVSQIETILTLPNGKRIRSTREALEEIL